jgi:hypothetical protein
MEINEIELSYRLAHERMLIHWDDPDDIYIDNGEGIFIYTDAAENIFNEYYDYYLTLIEKTKI